MGKRNKEELHLGLRDALEHGIVRNRQKPRTTRSRQSRAVGPAHRQKPPNKQRADRGSEIGGCAEEDSRTRHGARAIRAIRSHPAANARSPFL